MTPRVFEPYDLRKALGCFATGVTVVTTLDGDGAPRGFTANSFTSVSLDPPLVLVCVAKTAASCAVFSDAANLAVNILAETQQSVAAVFAARAERRFDAIDWTSRATGSPIIDGVVAWLDCRMHNTIEAGDHVILIGQVVDYQHQSQTPLGYCRGAYVSFGLAEEAIRATEDNGTIRVAAIVEQGGAVFLNRHPETGHITLPAAAQLGNPHDPSTLLGKLAGAGVDTALSFLFSVYEDRVNGVHNIVYRGEANTISNKALAHFVAFDRIPWDAIGDEAVRTMLQRYVRERQQDTFGVYVGDMKTGRVKTLTKDG